MTMSFEDLIDAVEQLESIDQIWLKRFPNLFIVICPPKTELC